MTRVPLLITRRRTDRGTAIYAAFDPADPSDADTLARLMKRGACETARVEADFSPATSGALNVPLRSEIEAERDWLRGLLREARPYLDNDLDGRLWDLLTRIDAALPQEKDSAA